MSAWQRAVAESDGAVGWDYNVVTTGAGAEAEAEAGVETEAEAQAETETETETEAEAKAAEAQAPPPSIDTHQLCVSVNITKGRDGAEVGAEAAAEAPGVEAPGLEPKIEAVEAPACRAGGVILFDFRIIHGGLPSLGRERPIAYAICSTGGAADESNFPTEGIQDATSGDIDEFLFWDEIEFVQ